MKAIVKTGEVIVFLILLILFGILTMKNAKLKEQLKELEAHNLNRLTGTLFTTNAPDYRPKLILQTSPPIVFEVSRGKLSQTPCEQLWGAFRGKDTTAIIKIRFDR